MNAPFQEVKPVSVMTCPAAISGLVAAPLLLPGESLASYQDLRNALFAEIAPRSTIEWLLAIDIAELCWEIQRYRLVRQKVLDMSRQRAIAGALNEIDLVGIAVDGHAEARRQTELTAHAWRFDPTARSEIDQRLLSCGIDQVTINATVYSAARELYLLFEGLIISAQHRRTALFREIDNHRCRSRQRS